MSKDLLNIKCRTCFNTTKGLKSLTTKTSYNKCYAEILEEITNINIMDSKYEELPQFICGYCSKRLKSAHAFIQQAKDVNEKLLSMVNKDSLKQELDCLQETQIDIESCLKLKQEYDDEEEELKNDNLELRLKLEASIDSLKDDIVTNESSSLETVEKLKCIKQTEVHCDVEYLKNLKENDTSDMEDKHIQMSRPLNHTMLDEIKPKSESDSDKADQSNDHDESQSEIDRQECMEITEDVKKAAVLKKNTKVKNKKLSQDIQNAVDVAVPCNKCNKIFVNSKALRIHQRISHIPEERKCTCNLCGSKFTRYCNMYKHMRTFHGPDSVTLMRKPAEGDDLYKCDKCPKKYSLKKSLSYHIKTKHLISQDVPANNNQNSSSVAKTKGTDKGSLCPICGSSFTSKSMLTVHIRRHTGERPFKCDLCERAFLLVTHLNSHKRVHTGEKPYKCQLCAKAFRESDHLRQHMRSHTDDRPFKCSQCERSFKYSQDLSKHLRANRERSDGRVCSNGLPRCSKISRANYLKMDTTENVMNQDVSF